MVPAPRLAAAPLGTQQIMIEFANRLDRFLQLLIIAQPAAHRGDALATHAQLPGAAAGIGHRHHEHPMAFAAPAFGAALGMVADGPRQQRAAQEIGGLPGGGATSLWPPPVFPCPPYHYQRLS